MDVDDRRRPPGRGVGKDLGRRLRGHGVTIGVG
jgi:hypothetical protein